MIGVPISKTTVLVVEMARHGRDEVVPVAFHQITPFGYISSISMLNTQYSCGRLIRVLQRRCRRQMLVLTTGTLPVQPSSITAGMATWRGVLRLK